MLASLVLVGLFNIITADPIRTFANGPSFGIIGGDPAKIEDHPYDVIVQFLGDDLFCAGAIVSDHHIVTIAQCASLITGHKAIIRAGTSTRGTGGTEHNIDKSQVTIHPDWNEFLGNNIAIVKVVEPFQFDKIPKAIALLSQDEKVENGTTGVITGWGETGASTSKQLQEVSVTTIDDHACEQVWPDEYVKGSSLCAQNFESSGKAACAGDFGDPLVFGQGQDKRLAGILAWAGFPCDSGRPSGYVNVAMYHDWIVNTIQH